MKITHPIFTLTALGLLIATLLALTYQFTHTLIQQNQQRTLEDTLNTLLPASEYNNDLLNSAIIVTDPLLGKQPQTIYLARYNQQPIALLLTTTAPDGYNGDIQLLLGVRYANNQLLGVRVLHHQETPGLGDQYKKNQNAWLTAFNNKSLNNPPLSAWSVKKEGGAFDQWTGATITPRAIVKAIAKALRYVEAHKVELFATTPSPQK